MCCSNFRVMSSPCSILRAFCNWLKCGYKDLETDNLLIEMHFYIKQMKIVEAVWYLCMELTVRNFNLEIRFLLFCIIPHPNAERECIIYQIKFHGEKNHLNYNRPANWPCTNNKLKRWKRWEGEAEVEKVVNPFNLVDRKFS